MIRSGNSSAAPPANSTEANQQSGNESGTSNASQGVDSAAGAKLTGKLNLINLDDIDPSILRGVRIMGNNVGTQDDINEKESSLDDVRCIFELGEWVEFYPDTDATYGLRVWILKHRDDQEFYNTAKFSDLNPNFANYCDLHYPRMRKIRVNGTGAAFICIPKNVNPATTISFSPTREKRLPPC